MTTARAVATTHAKKPAPLIFASDEGSRYVSGSVYAYANSGTNQSPLWAIGAPLKYPTGLWVDGSLNLYVADESGYVYEYDAPSASGPPSAPSFVYDDPYEQTDAVAVCGNYVYASNASGLGSHESFTVWQKGVASPQRIVSSPFYQGDGTGRAIVCDAASGTMYFGYEAADNGPGLIDKWAAGGTGSPTTLQMDPIDIKGFALSKTGILVLGNGYDPHGPAIEFYKTSGRTPTHIITGPWVEVPLGFAYETGDQALWVADVGTQALSRVNPGKGTVLDTITKPGFLSLAGVAVSPPNHL